MGGQVFPTFFVSGGFVFIGVKLRNFIYNKKKYENGRNFVIAVSISSLNFFRIIYQNYIIIPL